MKTRKTYRIKTISEFHKVRGLPKPEHPLISLIDYADIKHHPENNSINWVFDFYNISIKRGAIIKIRYGQQEYDFDEGVMFFLAPGQMLRIETDNTTRSQQSGWMLLIHPDFLWKTSLAQHIRQYEFFDYAINEALFLSDKEEATLNNIIENIRQEYHSNIDKFSQNIIVAHLEAMLNYAERFYQRQFITRKITNHKILDRLEEVLTRYFDSDHLITKGLPTVQFISEALNVSPNYLRSVLKVLTGQNTQQHIHEKLIQKAKEKLSTTELSVSEIAYALGFEHPQSFSKLFKTKTKLSPLEFRQSFN